MSIRAEYREPGEGTVAICRLQNVQGGRQYGVSEGLAKAGHVQREGVDKLHDDAVATLVDWARDWEAVLVQNLHHISSVSQHRIQIWNWVAYNCSPS